MTYPSTWVHTSQSIKETKLGIYDIEMSGRLNPFFGLSVMAEFDHEQSKIINITGSMRTGSKGQSVSIFKIDKNSHSRSIPPIRNPLGNFRVSAETK